jgi:hypothetical protein
MVVFCFGRCMISMFTIIFTKMTFKNTRCHLRFLYVSNFIMVPVTNNVDRPTEGRSPQNSELESNSDDDMSLCPASLDAILVWADTTEPSPIDNTLNLEKVFDNAFQVRVALLLLRMHLLALLL